MSGNPDVFGPPRSRSGSISQRYGSGSFPFFKNEDNVPVGSGSISQRCGYGDPDPHQNVMDPQHWDQGGQCENSRMYRMVPSSFPHQQALKSFLRYTSVADPGCLSRIPDPTFFHPGSRIRTVSIPDPGSRILIKEFKYFNPKKSKKMVSKL